MNVIDMKTRSPWRIDQHAPTDEERQAAFVAERCDELFFTAIKIRAVAGEEMTLRALFQTISDIKNYGRI